MNSFIYNIWSSLINFGVSDNWPNETSLIRMFNIASLFSGLGATFLCVVSAQMDFSSTYVLCTGVLAIIYLLPIIANYFEKIFLARYIITIGSILWVNGLYILIGGFFCQGMALLTSIVITYVAFRTKVRIRLFLLILHPIGYFIANIYVNSYGPIAGVMDMPYDEMVVFCGCIAWCVVVFLIFDSDRTKLLKSIRSNYTDLKNTTAELEQFTYIASHDLKSPLRTIHSFVGLIERDLERNSTDKIEERLKYVKSGAQRMNLLVEDMLELSKLNTENIAQRSLVDLNVVCNKALKNLTNEIEEKDAHIEFEALPTYVCNEVEFIVLFQNFIQNGIKYNKSDRPKVKISSQLIDENLQLSFEDNGIGIEKKYHKQIFKYFKRLHNENEYKGTGLGLGLCQKIVSKYKGEIKLDSALGFGTKIEIDFPLP